MKSGYLYCFIPKCEIEVLCIDINYNLNEIIKHKDIIFLKKICNPKFIKKIIYNKFKKYNLIENIFSAKKKNKILKFINRF